MMLIIEMVLIWGLSAFLIFFFVDKEDWDRIIKKSERRWDRMNIQKSIRMAISMQDRIDDLEECFLTFRQDNNITLEDLKAYRKAHFGVEDGIE